MKVGSLKLAFMCLIEYRSIKQILPSGPLHTDFHLPRYIPLKLTVIIV